MSQAEHHDFPVHSEHDRLPGRVIGIVFAATCVIAIGWVGVAWWLLDVTETSARPSGEFFERDIAPPTVVEGVENTLIIVDNPGAALAGEKRAVLDSYGWVDPAARVVRIPIDRAIELAAGGAR